MNICLLFVSKLILAFILSIERVDSSYYYNRFYDRYNNWYNRFNQRWRPRYSYHDYEENSYRPRIFRERHFYRPIGDNFDSYLKVPVSYSSIDKVVIPEAAHQSGTYDPKKQRPGIARRNAPQPLDDNDDTPTLIDKGEGMNENGGQRGWQGDIVDSILYYPRMALRELGNRFHFRSKGKVRARFAGNSRSNRVPTNNGPQGIHSRARGRRQNGKQDDPKVNNFRIDLGYERRPNEDRPIGERSYVKINEDPGPRPRARSLSRTTEDSFSEFDVDDLGDI